tara:strand:+ start:686 stop:1594 length:909 start_codon:yes stop_codon:yes gene_type:complete
MSLSSDNIKTGHEVTKANLAEYSDIIADINNIVSTDGGQVHLAKSFVDEFDFTKNDLAILDGCMDFQSGMTNYQCEHFVADTQITPWRKVRQALMELETRYHAYMENRHSLRKAELLRRKFLRSIENVEAEGGDDIDAGFIQIDLEKNDYDIGIWRRKLRQSELEIKHFLDVVNKYVDDEHPLEYFMEEQHDEERLYWVARMGKQAAMDIISYGRIGAGNMTTILDMPEEDQVKSLEVAVQFSGMIGGGIDKLQKTFGPAIQKQLEEDGITMPKFLAHKYTGQLHSNEANKPNRMLEEEKDA